MENKEFAMTAKLYEQLWKKADAEKRETGRISRKTTKELTKLEKELNK